MSVAEKLQTIADNQSKVYDAGKTVGKKLWSDNFWDMFFSGRNRPARLYDFSYAFYNFPEECFYPTMGSQGTISNKIKPGFATSMFENFNGGGVAFDLTARLEECGVTLDFSTCKYMDSTFKNAYVTTIPLVDCTAATSLDNTFRSCLAKTIAIKVKAANTYTGTFDMCSRLVNLTVEGEIGQGGLCLDACPLSKESIISVINALSDTTDGLEIELSEDAVYDAFTDGVDDEEWVGLVESKSNWTITLN